MLRNRVRFGALLLMVVALGPALADEKPSTLTVTGHGFATAQPDVATVTFAVTAQGKSAAEAQLQVSQIMARSLEAITPLGLPADAMTTTSITLLPLYRESDMGEETNIAGYRASNRIQVRSEVEKAGAIIDAVVGAGANEIESVTLGLKDESKTRGAALADAVRNARQHAEVMAAALGVRLLAVDEVTEQPIGFTEPVLRTMTGKSEAATPVQSGEIRLQASVVVRYRVSGDVSAAVPEKN